MSESKKASVKWFNDQKGYGFLIVESVNTDVFVHIKRLRESGIHEPLREGDKLSCEVNDGPRGLYAANLTREAVNATGTKT